MPTPELIEFGKQVRAARAKAGLKLSDLSAEIYDGDEGRKGYLSQVENGKRKLSPLTITKIADQLDISGPVLDRALGLGTTEDEAPNPLDAQATTMLARAEATAARLKLSESLVISLAYRYAEGNPTDMEGAIAGLEQALAAAQRIAERGATPSNHPDFLDQVFTEVARLNAEDRPDEAATALQEALAEEQQASAARQAKLFDGLLDQHLLLRDADAYAEILEQKLRLHGADDLFNRLRDLGIEHKNTGTRRGTAFDLRVAVAVTHRTEPLAANPEYRGWALNDLGVALSTLGARGDDAALQDAVTAYRDALKYSTRDALPVDWAMTQNNLGIALLSLGARGDDAALQDAVSAFRAALEIRTRDTLPVDWAMTQNNLGNALMTLGERGDDTALQDAVTAFRAAFEVRTRDAQPVQWAMTQNNLGNALSILGELGDDAALQDAVTAYRAALEVRTRDALPVDWATTQSNLGIALQALGQRDDDAGLHDAITAFLAALEVRTRDALPVDWAMTRENMALCFKALAAAHPTDAKHHFSEALAAVEDALTVYTSDQMPFYFDKATRLRDQIIAAQADL